MANDSAIHSWLSKLYDCGDYGHEDDRGNRGETTSVKPNLKPPRESEMTTPPASGLRTGSLSSGPRKRKVDDSREAYSPLALLSHVLGRKP